MGVVHQEADVRGNRVDFSLLILRDRQHLRRNRRRSGTQASEFKEQAWNFQHGQILQIVQLEFGIAIQVMRFSDQANKLGELRGK